MSGRGHRHSEYGGGAGIIVFTMAMTETACTQISDVRQQLPPPLQLMVMTMSVNDAASQCQVPRDAALRLARRHAILLAGCCARLESAVGSVGDLSGRSGSL